MRDREMNLQYKQQGTCNPKILKFTTGLIGMCLAGYILGPPLFWHLSESVASIGHYSCPPCHCHCNDQPLISLHQGTNTLNAYRIFASFINNNLSSKRFFIFVLFYHIKCTKIKLLTSSSFNLLILISYKFLN